MQTIHRRKSMMRQFNLYAMHSFHTYTSAYIYMLLHVRAPFYVYACSMGRTIIHVRYECLRHLHCTMYNGREKLIL